MEAILSRPVEYRRGLMNVYIFRMLPVLEAASEIEENQATSP
jgi:hypothetical protein